MTDHTLTPDERTEALALARQYVRILDSTQMGSEATLMAAALIASEERREELEATLRFYAYEGSWTDRYGDIDTELGSVGDDEGTRAREALEAT